MERLGEKTKEIEVGNREAGREIEKGRDQARERKMKRGTEREKKG